MRPTPFRRSADDEGHNLVPSHQAHQKRRTRPLREPRHPPPLPPLRRSLPHPAKPPLPTQGPPATRDNNASSSPRWHVRQSIGRPPAEHRRSRTTRRNVCRNEWKLTSARLRQPSCPFTTVSMPASLKMRLTSWEIVHALMAYWAASFGITKPTRRCGSVSSRMPIRTG